MAGSDLAPLLDALRRRLASHPVGPMVHGTGHRMGAALHSEDLCVIDLVATQRDTPWQARRAAADDAPSGLADPLDHAFPVPARFTRSAAFVLHEPLTLSTLPGMPLQHAKGGRYQGVAVAWMEGTPHAIYSDAQGLWWCRPWPMFADGRFVHDTPRTTAWIACLQGHLDA